MRLRQLGQPRVAVWARGEALGGGALLLVALEQVRAADRLGALDVGDVYVGVARADGRLGIAAPHDGVPLRRDKGHFPVLVATLKTRAWAPPRPVRGVVVGYPLLLDGREGLQCLRTLKFLRTLLNPVHGVGIASVLLLDERLSTQDAKGELRTQGVRPRQMRAHGVDHLAATEFLRQYLAQTS